MASSVMRKATSLLRHRSRDCVRQCLSARSSSSSGGEDSPVLSWNEWDPLEEIIVGRAEGQRIPFLEPDIKVGH